MPIAILIVAIQSTGSLAYALIYPIACLRCVWS